MSRLHHSFRLCRNFVRGVKKLTFCSLRGNNRCLYSTKINRNDMPWNIIKPVEHFHGTRCLIFSRCVSNFIDNCKAEILQGQENDEVIQQLYKAQTASELMDLIKVVRSSCLTPLHTALITRHLVVLHYQAMCAVHSWLQSNLHVAQIQLQLCGHDALWKFCRSVHLHPSYCLWLEMIERDCSAYTTDQLADSLLAVLYLGVATDSSTVHRLIAETHRRLETFGFQALATATNALRSLAGPDFVAKRLTLKRLEVLLNATQKVTGEDLSSLSTVVILTMKLINDSCMQKLVYWLQQMIHSSNSDLLINPDHLGSFLRMIHRLTMLPHVEKRLSLELVNFSVEACYQTVDKFSAANIADICHSLKLSRRYERELSRVVEQRADDLLDENCRLCDVSNLMYSLTRNTPPSMILRFTGALHSRLMRSDDVDIVVLSNIADVLRDLPNVGVDLMELFQRRVVDRVDDIVTYISRYNKIVKLLIRRRFVDRELESRFTDRLLAHLEHHDGIHMHNVSAVAAYLLPASRGALPPLFFDRLLTAVPRWREPELYRLAVGVNSIRQPLSATMKRQLAQIQSALHANIDARLDTVQSFDDLYQLTMGWVVHSRYRDPTLTDRLMSMYAHFSANLADSISTIKIAQIFTTIGYHMPIVYDDLVRYVIKSANPDDDTAVMHVLAACAKVGYQSSFGDDLLNLACCTYRKLIAQRDYKTALQQLLNLMILQLYPENDLLSLFTLESIEDLERYMTENPENIKNVERLMMELNRSVILECPQLDVPWFHEQYCTENVVKDADEYSVSAVGVRLRNEVYDVICEVLGGSQFVQKNTYSPYYYEIDFECLLDEKLRPVIVNHWHSTHMKQTCQRIAISVLPESSYCYNSKQLVGHKQMQKRHLEIMDYKFAEVPYFDWFSMGLTDQQSKFDYVEAKLMRN